MQELIDTIIAAMRSGRHADALSLSRTLVQSFPEDESSLSMLAVSEQNAGNLSAAKDMLRGMTQRYPGTWQHWNNLGNVLRLQNELLDAAHAYARALELNTTSARLRANFGLLCLNLGRLAEAREHLCAACALDGAEYGMRVWAAVACHAFADDETARALTADWQAWPRPSDEAMLELGWLLFLLGDHRGGMSILDGEFQDPDLRRRALARHALALERLNRIEGAVALTERMSDAAQIVDPQARMETLQALAVVAARRQDYSSAKAHYAAALTMDLPQRTQQPLYFGLARVCDQLGETAQVMDALAHAHAGGISRRATAGTAAPEGSGLLSLADPKFTVSDAHQWSLGDAPTSVESPVFVVGFPRSGTTLLEQMLAAHDGFVSADERPMVARMLERMRRRGFKYPEGLSDLSVFDCDELRAVYWLEARKSVTLNPGVRLVDKQPLNFLALPMIQRVFANAPVIFCLRHPCDAVLSAYMQHFRDPRLATECTSIEKLATLYVRLSQRWINDMRWVRSPTLVCRYEDLISDTDPQLRRLGEFVGIADVSAMRNHAEHAHARGFIGTPSYAQVVQPLNMDAAGRWKRYRRYLEPVLPVLAPIIDYWGYER